MLRLNVSKFDKNLILKAHFPLFYKNQYIVKGDFLATFFIVGFCFLDTGSHKKRLNCVHSNQNLLTIHVILSIVILIKRITHWRIIEANFRGKN